MVGVPGKSKGCSTCRRRKKGCDQKRPTCGQCLQSGYICGGYQRDLTFVVHPASKLAEKSFYISPSSLTGPLTLPSTLDRSAMESQCRALFWDLYLPRGVAEAHDNFLAKCNHPPNWTSLLLEFPHDEPSLNLAFSALSFARVGRSNNDMRLVKESTRFYGRALQDLQKALFDPSRMHTEEVLAACSLLGLYEMFEGDAATGRSVGWVSHAQGAARLIELRGPDRHIERQGHHVFLGARLPIIYSALLRRKKTFLASEEWTTVPWTKAVKTPGDRLIDIAAKLPSVLEHFDDVRAQAASSDARNALTSLLSACTQLRTELDQWETRRSPMARPKSVEYKHQINDCYPYEYRFSWENHLFMNATLVYWTCHLMLATTMNQIEFLLANLGFPQSNMFTSTTSIQQQARQYATSIAQSIPYALMPDMGALGINYITFPMCLTFQHFVESNEHDICSWIIQVCNSMRRKGLRMRTFDDTDTSSHVSSRKSSIDHETSPSEPETPGTVVPDVFLRETTCNSATASGADGSFKSTFIFENPARYYIDSSEPG